jgi:hypothetical protein
VAEKKKEDPLDLDSLLADTAPPDPEPEPEAVPEPENETLRRIREVEAELAKPKPEPTVEEGAKEFVPTAKLSQTERKLRDLEDALAKRRAEEAEAAPTAYDDAVAEGADIILIHFLEDGFVFGGMTWYRGQEVSFVRGSLAYEQTKNRNGWTWVDLAGDVAGQYQKWGKQYLGVGPWPGKPWNATEGLPPEEQEAARLAAEAEAKRGRKAPVVRI